MTTIDRPTQTTTEWRLTRYNLDQIDDQLDADGVYAKGYWESVDGQLTVTGLRIGSSYTDRIVAKFGDTVIRHADGTYSVRTAAQQAALRFKEAQLAEQRHQYLDLDADSAYTVPGCVCSCPPKPAEAA